MKNLASILVLVFAFTLTTQAQKKRKQKRPQFSTEQQVNLAVKKMTLALDLSEKQQNQIRPLLDKQITERKAALRKRKTTENSEKRPTSDEIYKMKSKRLDSQIMMKNKIKNILNKEQFEKFEKMHKEKERRCEKRIEENKY